MRATSILLASPLLVISACGLDLSSDDSSFHSSDDPTGDHFDDDDDIADDDDTSGDDDDVSEQALVGYYGIAVVGESSYEGSEQLYFTTQNGLGEDVCRIGYKLSAVAVREDCEQCEWAFELQASEPEFLSGTPEACAVLGFDSAGIVGLLDKPRVYGFAWEYFGHADVLMVLEEGGHWQAESFADWNQQTGVLRYNWAIGCQQT